MLGSGSATPVTSAINPTVFSKPASLELIFFLHLMLTIRVADPVGSYRDPDSNSEKTQKTDQTFLPSCILSSSVPYIYFKGGKQHEYT